MKGHRNVGGLEHAVILSLSCLGNWPSKSASLEVGGFGGSRKRPGGGCSPHPTGIQEQDRYGLCLHGASGLVGESITDEIKLFKWHECCAEVCNVIKQVQETWQGSTQDMPCTLKC